MLSAVVVVELTAGAPDGARDQASHEGMRAAPGRADNRRRLSGALGLCRSLVALQSRGRPVQAASPPIESHRASDLLVGLGFPIACKKGRRPHSIDCGCLVDFAEQYASNAVLPKERCACDEVTSVSDHRYSVSHSGFSVSGKREDC